MVNAFENTYSIYQEIVNNTIFACAEFEETAILLELKSIWLRKLDELCSKKQDYNFPPDQITSEVSKDQEDYDDLNTGVSNFTKVNDSITKVIIKSKLPENSAELYGYSELAQADNCFSKTSEFSDDDWGDWENADDGSAKQVSEKPDQVDSGLDDGSIDKSNSISGGSNGNVNDSNINKKAAEGAQEADDKKFKLLYPEDEDFDTQLKTGFGNFDSDFGIDDFDKINSDLDEVDTLSCDEPMVIDTIIGVCEKLVKPSNKNLRSCGTWRINLKNGIANIDNTEVLFNSMLAELHY